MTTHSLSFYFSMVSFYFLLQLWSLISQMLFWVPVEIIPLNIENIPWCVLLISETSGVILLKVLTRRQTLPVWPSGYCLWIDFPHVNFNQPHVTWLEASCLVFLVIPDKCTYVLHESGGHCQPFLLWILYRFLVVFFLIISLYAWYKFLLLTHSTWTTVLYFYGCIFLFAFQVLNLLYL